MFEEKMELENYFKKLDYRNIITLCRFRLKQTGGKSLQEKHKCFNCVIIVKIETIFSTYFRLALLCPWAYNVVKTALVRPMIH
jgi:hypothetical protein